MFYIQLNIDAHTAFYVLTSFQVQVKNKFFKWFLRQALIIYLILLRCGLSKNLESKRKKLLKKWQKGDQEVDIDRSDRWKDVITKVPSHSFGMFQVLFWLALWTGRYEVVFVLSMEERLILLKKITHPYAKRPPCLSLKTLRLFPSTS